MCAMVQCAECRRWRLVACDQHGWTLDDLPGESLCRCAGAGVVTVVTS